MHFLKTLLISALIIATIVPISMGATTQNLSALSHGEDGFYNYDFLSNTASSTNVDWPITMVFYNNAEVTKVKNIFFGSALLAWSMYEYLNDGTGWVWDDDKGTKGEIPHGIQTASCT